MICCLVQRFLVLSVLIIIKSFLFNTTKYKKDLISYSYILRIYYKVCIHCIHNNYKRIFCIYFNSPGLWIWKISHIILTYYKTLTSPHLCFHEKTHIHPSLKPKKTYTKVIFVTTDEWFISKGMSAREWKHLFLTIVKTFTKNCVNRCFRFHSSFFCELSYLRCEIIFSFLQMKFRCYQWIEDDFDYDYRY